MQTIQVDYIRISRNEIPSIDKIFLSQGRKVIHNLDMANCEWIGNTIFKLREIVQHEN